jgi:hypothetical protein
MLTTIPSCKDCDDYYDVPGYRITVVDSETRAAICDAEVSVSEEEANRSSVDCT